MIRRFATLADLYEDWTMTAILCAKDGTALQLHDTTKNVDLGIAGLADELAESARLFRDRDRGKAI